jgi:hypothetical protein
MDRTTLSWPFRKAVRIPRRFYADILGMSEIEKPPVLAARGGCWFRSGRLELHLGVETDFEQRPRRIQESLSEISTRSPHG